MFLTLAESKAALVVSSTEDAINITAGLCQALESKCNRVFPHAVESIDADGTTATVTVYRHGLRAGDRVRLVTEQGGTQFDMDSPVVLDTGLTRDVFQVSCELTAMEAESVGRASMRPVRVGTYRTSGGYSVFVDWRPLVDVISFSVPDSYGDWAVKPSTQYGISATTNGGASLTGEVSLRYGTLPCGRNGRKHPNGVKIEYVSGEDFLTPEAYYVLTKCLSVIYARLTQSGIQGESLEYYSYSRSSSSDIGALFGEFDGILGSLRIPC